MKKIALFIVFAFICAPGFVFAQNSRSLDLGDASGATGETVYLPLTISGTGGEVGGTAFTLEFDSNMFEVVEIKPAALPNPEVVDPEIYCDTVPCDNPYTTNNGPVGTGALFFQFNDDRSGKALVAAAAAEPVSDNVTLMEIGLKIIGSVSTETVFDINLNQTDLPQNTAAGYDDPTSNPIPLLSGMPADTADANGDYPVLDTFSVTLTDGSIAVAPQAKGDANGDDQVNNIDALVILYCFANPNANGCDLSTAIADVNGDGQVNNIDALVILYCFANPNANGCDF